MACAEKLAYFITSCTLTMGDGAHVIQAATPQGPDGAMRSIINVLQEAGGQALEACSSGNSSATSCGGGNGYLADIGV